MVDYYGTQQTIHCLLIKQKLIESRKRKHPPPK